ncbi:MAG: resolvase [Oscillospiraceae bacterium]|nr:resolvase [Oscillospiraceae bacterium]
MQPKVALYLRLSREDDERELESQSIANQREFLLQYTAQQDWSVAGIYTDDGWTGTNFDRPEFQRMLRDIEERKIDTVITKDLSRLGRDYIGVGHYLERYFPTKGIRYIAVNEHIDTGQPSAVTQLTPFLAVVNDFYAADISRKVKAALDTRKREGLFIGAQPPLGYGKHPTQKGKLTVDPETAPIIQTVFQIYLSCGSLAETARELSRRGLPTPADCKKGVRGGGGGMWSDSMARRILTNPTYAGHLTQSRVRKVSYKVNRKVSLPPSQWVVIANTHEPLVEQQDFDRAQEMISVRSYVPHLRGGGHLLTGLVFCADCGAPMTYVRESERRTYLVCQGYRRGGREKVCTSHCIREDYLLETIREQLMELSGYLDTEALLTGMRERHERWKNRQMEVTRKNIERCKSLMESIYRDKASGMISELEFYELVSSVRREREHWEGSLAGTDSSKWEGQDDARECLNRLLSFQPLERPVLTMLVERVAVHQNKELELSLRFREPETESCRRVTYENNLKKEIIIDNI